MRWSKKSGFALFAMLAVGALAFLAFQLNRQREANLRMKEELEQSKLLCTQSETAKSELERKLARLRDRLDDPVVTQPVEPIAAPAGEDVALVEEEPEAEPTAQASQIEQGIRQAIQQAIQQGMDTELAKAQQRLNLSDDQVESIRGFVESAFAEGGENLRKLLEGEAAPDQMPSAEEWGLELEQKMLAVLTPEQQADYWKYKRQDSMAQARAGAGNEIAQLQRQLDLTADQQEQVFDVLYQQQLNRLDPDPTTLDQRPLDEIEAAEWDLEQSLTRLQSILSEEQLEQYRKEQEQRLNFMRNLRTMFQPGQQ
ncbi:MAG: hypothetical protein QM518_11280 [Verrucomicrobiota bacterium]|nr:hypothetical protein [Verrucomicrobiota bacterium]